MRAVLRTVAQCHYHRILHRDIKPGNFMLLEDDPLSPVKAIGEAPDSSLTASSTCPPMPRYLMIPAHAQGLKAAFMQTLAWLSSLSPAICRGETWAWRAHRGS